MLAFNRTKSATRSRVCADGMPGASVAPTGHNRSTPQGLPPRRRWKRLYLLVAMIWLQVVTVGFLGLMFASHVRTPVTEWLGRALTLLGM